MSMADLHAGTGEAAGRALLQQTLQGPYLPDVLASQNGGWQCQGNTCQRKHMTYDDMWLFYHMFYEPPAPPPPPPPEKELVIKRVYGCHDDDDVRIPNVHLGSGQTCVLKVHHLLVSVFLCYVFSQ